MNSTSTRDEMTVKLLIQLGMGTTTVLPLLALLVLGSVAATRLSGGAVTLVILVMLGGMIALVLTTAFIHAAVQRRLREQFLTLVDICRDYAGGDHTVRASVSGDDAFALLVMALNTLLDSQALEDPEQDINRAQDYRISALQAQVERLLRDVGIVAQGELPLQSGVSAEALGLLADSFAYMIEALAQTTKQIHVSAAQATTVTNQMLERAEGLDRESEEQFAALGQVIQEVERLAVFLQNVARNVQLGAEGATDALAHMQQGKAAVHQVLEGVSAVQANVSETAGAISRLDSSALEFTEVLRTFTDVVEHLGQLAENAQVLESFAAGEARAGAGIADDIRHIAGRTAALHTRLGELVARVQAETHAAAHALETNSQVTNEGAHQFAEAGRALSALGADVSRIAQLMAQFTREADAQAPHSEEVAAHLSQCAEAMAETHAHRQEALQGIPTLLHLTEQLRLFVSTIQLPEFPLLEESEAARHTHSENHTETETGIR